jgi:GAF domain-containing protein
MPTAAPIPEDEPERMAALLRYEILDTPADDRFDRIVRIAMVALGTPMAMISLIDRSRCWLKSSIGMPQTEYPRDHSICAHALVGDDVMVVPDASRDPRFFDNVFVHTGPRVRFVAVAPVITGDGRRIGAVSVCDRLPRSAIAHEQLVVLRDLAVLALDEMELHRTVASLNRGREEAFERSRVRARMVG